MIGSRRPVTPWLIIVTSQIVAALLLQSCKNDQAAERTPPGSQVADRRGDRAVFGSGPPPVTPSPVEQPQPTKSITRSAPETNKPQERSRRAPEAPEDPPKEIAASRPQPSRSPVGDPGEQRARQGTNASGSNRGQQEPAAERFLHYQPPGSRVGDAGELSQQRDAEPQVSTSAKPIRDLIKRWADTMLAGNLVAHIGLYSPVLESFYGSANVPLESVRDYKQQVLSRSAGMRRFDIYDVSLQLSGSRLARAELRIEANGPGAGLSGWYRIEFRQVRGQWKISNEEKVQPMSRRQQR